jgi:O-antigen/teichoic acid export membrane protein
MNWNSLYRDASNSKLVRNILTNYLAAVWMGGLSILLIPVYFKQLGDGQWGIVAICMALQGFFYVLDAGLGQIMPRDIARVAKNNSLKLKTYRIYSNAYLFLGGVGFIAGQIAVPWLVSQWFGGGKAYDFEDSIALHLVMLQFFFQFSNNANIGYWNGTEAQAQASLRQCGFGSLKHLGALLSVYFWHASATYYLIPFVLISLIEFLLNRRIIFYQLKSVISQSINWREYLALAHEAGNFFIGIFIGIMVSQIDRILLSHYLDTSVFGIYIIISSLGLAFMQLQYPLVRAFLPKITQGNDASQKSSFRNLNYAILFFCVIPCISMALMSPWILSAWISNSSAVSEGALPFSLIVISVALNSLYQLIYLRILVTGNGSVVIKINFMILLIGLIILLITVDKMGIISGGIYWVVVSVSQLILGIIWMKLNSLKIV